MTVEIATAIITIATDGFEVNNVSKEAAAIRTTGIVGQDNIIKGLATVWNRRVHDNTLANRIGGQGAVDQ